MNENIAESWGKFPRSKSRCLRVIFRRLFRWRGDTKDRRFSESPNLERMKKKEQKARGGLRCDSRQRGGRGKQTFSTFFFRDSPGWNRKKNRLSWIILAEIMIDKLVVCENVSVTNFPRRRQSTNPDSLRSSFRAWKKLASFNIETDRTAASRCHSCT